MKGYYENKKRARAHTGMTFEKVFLGGYQVMHGNHTKRRKGLMKNKKMSTVITVTISLVMAVCILLLFLVSNRNMLSSMQEAAMNNMATSLGAKSEIVEQYVNQAEELLISFGKAPVVAEFLKNPNSSELEKKAQAYTESYFAGLEGWEGIYIGEWNTHVITHSNVGAVGMVMREGESLEKLQNSMIAAGDVYNTGMMVSPASKRLVLSLYAPVYDKDGTTILGFVGGAQLAETLQTVLEGLNVEGMENAKNYMINTETEVHIFNEDASLMAAPIEDEMLLSVIEAIRQNPAQTTGSFEYVDADGVKSIAVYRSLPERDWAVVLSDSQDEIFAEAYTSRNIFGLICVCVYAIIPVLCWLFVSLCVKPLKVVEKSVIKLKNLELETPGDLKKYIGTGSETGQIATAMDSLYETFRGIVFTLRECTTTLNTSTDKMNHAAHMLIEGMGDNSATTEELAASITTTNSAIEQMVSEIATISELVGKVEEKVSAGDRKSEDLLQTAQSMRDMAGTTLTGTGEKIQKNRKNVEAAMVNLKSLTRINDMAKQILDIANQTNLLSLNASIEAARAGENGRGFAVVAQEIGALASNSSTTAKEIQEICKDINSNIENVQECVDDIIGFMESDVSNQFKEFVDIANEYSTSVEEIRGVIGEIEETSNGFVTSVASIREKMDVIHTASSENEIGVGEIVNKIEQTNTTAEEIESVGKTNRDNAQAISAIVEKFTE